jgi:hypothetical protein
MHIFSEIFLVLLALLIIVSIGLGLLIAVVILILGKRRNMPSEATIEHPAFNQRRRSLYASAASIAVSVGFAALVFASRLIPIEENIPLAWIIIISGIMIIAAGLFFFREI